METTAEWPLAGTGLWEPLLVFLLIVTVRTHKHIRCVDMAQESYSLMDVYVSQKMSKEFCVYFLNKKKYMWWMSFDFSVMVFFIVSLCVGDRPLGLTRMTEERTTICTYTNTCMCTCTHISAHVEARKQPDIFLQPNTKSRHCINQSNLPTAIEQSIRMRPDASN